MQEIVQLVHQELTLHPMTHLHISADMGAHGRLRFVLLERDQELELMTDLLAGVDSSGGKAVLIRGEAGIGKSSLVKEFVRRHSEVAHVYLGSCDDLLTPQPLGPFWDIARKEASLARPLEQGDRPAVLSAALELLSSSLRPGVLVVEDTHWADEATLDAIRYLGRRIGQTNGLLLLTYRDGDVDYDHPLRGVIGDLPPQDVLRIRLGGLSARAVASIVAGSDLDPDDVLSVTDGNPFLVTEMASVQGGVVPSSVQDSVMGRAATLSPEARDLLKTLSVIPERVPLQDVEPLTNRRDTLVHECEQRGLVDVDGQFVAFRHELIRRAVETSLTATERVEKNRRVLARLPADTDAALLVHHAREASDLDQLVALAPRAARAAATLGSHREAAEHFRQLTMHLDRLDPDLKGPILDEWAHEEFLVDNVDEAISLNTLALLHYEHAGDLRAESRALARGAHFHELAGQRNRAEHMARKAVDVLGPEPDGGDLAEALEVNAFLQMMAGNLHSTEELVDQTLEAAGPDIDERVLIRSLNHRGIAANIANYPAGLASLEEARLRSEVSGQWYEECRALVNLAWAATESRDLPRAHEYARKAIASGDNHEIRTLETYGIALFARVLELQGEWNAAEDLARAQLGSSAITQMVMLPIIGIIEARTGGSSADSILMQAWEASRVANEFQRLGPVAIALAEKAWISRTSLVPIADLRQVMQDGLEKGFKWSPGAIALWLWKQGELSLPPDGIADPYRLLIEGEPLAAAEVWANIGCPYERAIALSHGDRDAQLEALEALESLGASTIAAKHRRGMREAGFTVGRGKSQRTRSHVAGLTARQAEVLQLLDEGLSNTEIADLLFLSPRTVENHVSGILSKLDSSTRTEAVSRARSEGLLASKSA